MQRQRGVVVTRGIRRVVAVIQTGVSTFAVAEHRLRHVLIRSKTIHADSNAGEGLCDLTNSLTFGGDSVVIITAGANLTITHLTADGRNGRRQIAVVVQAWIPNVGDKGRHRRSQHIILQAQSCQSTQPPQRTRNWP